MGKTRYVAVTAVPLLFLMSATFSAGYIKIFDPNPKMGFLAAARDFGSKIANGGTPQQIKDWSAQQINFQVDVVVTAFFLIAVAIVFVGCAIEWARLLSGSKKAETKESPYIKLETIENSSLA